MSLWNPDRGTANDRFKTRCRSWFWGGLMMATAAHFTVFMFFPMLTAADLSFGVTELEAIELPPEVEIPPPPEAIQRPAVPVVAQAELEEDITIAPTTFEENPVEQLPAPPGDSALGLNDQPVFTPYTVAPELKDREAAAEIVRQAFPKTLMAAEIGGEEEVWAFIDEKGVVKNCQVQESSGYAGLDRAALKAVMQFSFLPALNYDRKVAVWVQMPIMFKVAR
ncbi:MAG: energy transducer TonB [Planctomycetota bacterium]